MSIRLRVVAFVIVASALSSPLVPPGAQAATTPGDEVEQLLTSLPAHVPDFDSAGTASPAVPPGSTSSSPAAIEESEDVDVSAAGVEPLPVDLVSASAATAVTVSRSGLEIIDNDDGSLTVPIAREDGSLQVVTVIESPQSPSNYAMEVDLPATAEWSELEGGALTATDPAGRLILGVAPPWAFDAAGTPVPTRYVVGQSRITQVVDHSLGEYQYPIAADPWLGVRLFDPMRVNRNGTFDGRNVYSGQLTAWGVAMGLSPSGFAIMTSAGWEEFASQWSAVRNSRSMFEQYQCHALWGRAIIGAGLNWDLEASRPSSSGWANVAAHRCNW